MNQLQGLEQQVIITTRCRIVPPPHTHTFLNRLIIMVQNSPPLTFLSSETASIRYCQSIHVPHPAVTFSSILSWILLFVVSSNRRLWSWFAHCVCVWMCRCGCMWEEYRSSVTNLRSATTYNHVISPPPTPTLW